jgi:hypothetical protein
MSRLRAVVYWLAVLAVSLVLVILLILFLESRDDAELGASDGAVAALTASSRPA